MATSDISPVFILPGIYGEKSELENFRSRLSDKVILDIIELQSLEEPLADLVSITAIGASVAREIDRRNPWGSLRLAGYSFGGAVAFEAARHLINSGREVHFLGLIDVILPLSPTPNGQQNWLGQRLSRLAAKIHAGASDGFSGIAYRLLRELLGRFCSSDSRRRIVLATVRRILPSRVTFVRRMLFFHFRRQAMEHWQPAPIQAPVFVAISQENPAPIEKWKSLCPTVDIVQLPGGHVNVFEAPSLHVLLPEFGNAVRNATLGKLG